jgi:hypothetical protein
MNTRLHRMRSSLLELGMEDWIAIPEAFGTQEVCDAAGPEDAAELISQALTSLVSDGRVRLYRGRWDSEKTEVPMAEALELLKNPYWYSYHLDDTDEERMEFVNVDNLAE